MTHPLNLFLGKLFCTLNMITAGYLTPLNLQHFKNIAYVGSFLGLSWVVFPDFFENKNYQNSENITPSFNRFHSQILLNDFGFGDFSIPPRHVDRCGIIPNPSKSSPGGLWKRLIDFLSQGSP